MVSIQLPQYSTYCRHDPNIADPNIVDLYEEPVPSVEQDVEPPTIDALSL